MSATTTLPERSATTRATILPPLVAVAALAVLGWLDLDHPISLAVLGGLGALAFALALRGFPVLLFWAVPVMIVSPLYLPLLPYEAVMVLLALPLVGQGLVRHVRVAPILDAIEWRYLLFLLLLLPGALGVVNWWRYVGQLKMFALGLVAFELTRRAVPRFGREALLWGPAFFCAATFAQLLVTMTLSGVPWFKSVELRTMVSDLGWMHANGIPSTMLLCAPAILMLVRLTPPRSWRRVAAVTALLSPFIVALMVAARGPFLLAAGYLLVVAVRIRRSFWLALGVAALITVPLFWTPMGQGMIERFTNARAPESLLFRVNSWGIGWQRGVTHLPWGVGAGQGMVQNDALLDEDPHNFAITLFSETGPLATLVWFWMVVVLWRAANRIRRQPGGAEVATALKGTLALAMLNAMFDPTLKANQMYHLFWWNLGVLEAGFLRDEAVAAGPAAVSSSSGSPLPSARPATAP